MVKIKFKPTKKMGVFNKRRASFHVHPEKPKIQFTPWAFEAAFTAVSKINLSNKNFIGETL